MLVESSLNYVVLFKKQCHHVSKDYCTTCEPQDGVKVVRSHYTDSRIRATIPNVSVL